MSVIGQLTNKAREATRVLRAFLRRDVLDATSYKVAFAYQVATLGSSVLTVYFLSRMVSGADVESLRRWGGAYFPFALLGVAVADYLNTSLTGFSRGIRLAQTVGTLEAMLATPTSPSLIVAGSALYRFTWSAVRVAMYVLAGMLLGASYPNANISTAMLVGVLSVTSFAALGLFAASLVLLLKTVEPISKLIAGLSWLFGGVLYPIGALPEQAQLVAWCLPVTHSLEGIRAALLLGASPSAVGAQLLWLSVFSLVILPLSLLSFQRAVRRLRIEGSVSHY